MKPNYDAMQVTKAKGQKNASRPGDTNLRHMTMGSWKADASKGGAKRQK